MSARRFSIGQIMMVVALTAVNLAVARATPWEIASYPSIWVLLGSLDFLVLWKLILFRSLRAFHYTFLIVFVVGYFVTANLVATERFDPLALPIRLYQYFMDEMGNGILFGFLALGEFWAACYLSFVLACVAGWVASWLERRRGWDIAAFWRGALIGFVIVNQWALMDGALWGLVDVSPARMTGRWVIMAVFPILGGLVGLFTLKSTTTGREGTARED